jgi:small subunit ribosomal protein S1
MSDPSAPDAPPAASQEPSAASQEQSAASHDSPTPQQPRQGESSPVDPYDKTDASHSTAAHDNPSGPSNPTLPGEQLVQAAEEQGGGDEPILATPASGGSNDADSFRANQDADLDAEVEAALAGTDVSSMLDESAKKAGSGSDRLRGTQAGTVSRVDLSKGEILVDLGGKHQAVVASKDFDPAPAEGEFVELEIEKYDADEGLYRAHKKGAARKVTGFDELRVGQVVEAVVTGMNKGGLECRVGQTAIRAFMPAGQIDVEFHKDISVFLNEKITARIQKLDKAARNVILSRRQVVERERRDARTKTMQSIAVGQTYTGTVKMVKDFGAFVDIGGVDGLLHVSQLTHKRMANAEDFVNQGQEVEVTVTSFEKGGKGGGKIGLALSHRPPDPWEQAETNFSPGTGVTGKVTRVENFGCFVELEEGIEALLPASEMSWRRIRHPSEMLNVGETVRGIVLNLDAKARKLSISLKQASGDPWAEAASQYPAGSTQTVKITRTTDFGAFAELTPGVEGLIHISEMSNQRIRRVEDVLQQGQETQARVLEVDTEKRRLRLTLKEHDPEAEAKLQRDVETTQARKKERSKRLSKKPLKGGLDF